RRCITVREAVIREPSTQRVEIIVALFQRVQEIGQSNNARSARGFQLRKPGFESNRILCGQRLVRAESRVNTKIILRGIDGTMSRKIVSGVIGAANYFDLKLFKNALRAEIAVT